MKKDMGKVRVFFEKLPIHQYDLGHDRVFQTDFLQRSISSPSFWLTKVLVGGIIVAISSMDQAKAFASVFKSHQSFPRGGIFNFVPVKGFESGVHLGQQILLGRTHFA